MSGRHYLVLLCVFCLHQLVFMRLWQDFWYLDDAGIYEWVGRHENPVDFFLKPEEVRAGGMEFYVTPWRQLSVWLDGHLAPLSPRLAYLHSLFSLGLALALLFAVARRFMSDNAALAGACLWLLLTSTSAVAEWLSARHYLEGLVLALTGIWCLLHSFDREGRRRFGWYLLAIVGIAASVLAKEVYATTALWLAFCMAMYRRRFAEVGGLVLIAAAYACYRWWTVGLTLAAGNSNGGLQSDFFWRFPSYFGAGPWGYVFAVVGLVALVLAVRQRKVEPVHWFFWGTGFMVALLPIQHLIVHLADVAPERGDWFRVVFVWNTLLLFLGTWLVDRMERPRLALGSFLLALAVLLPVCHVTSRGWDQRKQQYAAYGRFYLANGDKLLYIPLRGYYLGGLHRLYRAEERPHFIKDRMEDGDILATMGHYRHLYGPVADEIAVIPDGHRTIWANARSGRRPLLREPPPDEKLLSAFRGETELAVESEGLVVVPPSYYATEKGVLWDVPVREDRAHIVPLDLEGSPFLLLCDEAQPSSVIELSFLDNVGGLLSRREVDTQGGRFHEPLMPLLPPETRLLTLRSDGGLRAWMYFRIGGSNLMLTPTLGLPSPPVVWMAHNPNAVEWTTKIRLYGPGGRVSARLYPLDEGGRVQPVINATADEVTAAFSLPPGTFAARIHPEPGTFVAVELRVVDSFDVARYQPVQQPTTRFLLQPSRSQLLWQGLAVLNSGRRPAEIQILDGKNGILRAETLAPGRKWVRPLSDQARALQSDQSVVCLVLQKIKDGPLVAFEPANSTP